MNIHCHEPSIRLEVLSDTSSLMDNLCHFDVSRVRFRVLTEGLWGFGQYDACQPILPSGLVSTPRASVAHLERTIHLKDLKSSVILWKKSVCILFSANVPNHLE